MTVVYQVFDGENHLGSFLIQSDAEKLLMENPKYQVVVRSLYYSYESYCLIRAEME